MQNGETNARKFVVLTLRLLYWKDVICDKLVYLTYDYFLYVTIISQDQECHNATQPNIFLDFFYLRVTAT